MHRTLPIIASLFLVSSSLAWAQKIPAHQHTIFSQVRPTLDDPNWVDAGILVNNRVPGRGPNFIQLERIPSIYERIPLVQHEFEKKYAQSIFVAQTGTGSAEGTAFLVGKNLVLTNQHVLASPSECGKFAIYLNNTHEKVLCEKVEYCDPVEDACLIRMKPLFDGRSIGDVTAPLNLHRTLTPKTLKSDAMLFIIGNACAMGMQAASYPGAVVYGNRVGHCTRAFGGNSGSPILDDQGNVLGIHFARGALPGISCPADRDIGLAVSSTYILNAIQKANPAAFSEIE